MSRPVDTKYQRIKALLESGREVDMQELNAISFRYGAVLHRLRHELGWVIETIPVDRATGHFRYRLGDRPLVHVPESPRPTTSPP